MSKALAQFSIARTGEDYLMTIEDADGESNTFTLDADQFDLMIEAIEEQLDADDDAAIDDDEDEDADEDADDEDDDKDDD